MSPIGGSDRHISCSTKSVAPSLSHAMVGDGLMLLGNFSIFKNILNFIVAGYTVTSNGWFKEEKVIHFETKYLSPVQSNPDPPEKEVCVSKAVHFKREFMFPIQLRIVNPISLRSPWFHEIHEGMKSMEPPTNLARCTASSYNTSNNIHGYFPPPVLLIPLSSLLVCLYMAAMEWAKEKAQPPPMLP